MKKLIILLFPLLLSGCWNYRELNDIAIASAIAIERKNDKFVIAVQIMNAKKGSSEGGTTNSGNTTPITVLETTGDTIHEALRNIVLKSPRKLYIGHMDLLILDEKIAYTGINDIIDFFMRDPESRKQFKVLISRDNDPSELIKILTPLENLPSKDLLSSIKVTDVNKSSISEISYDELLSHIYAEGYDAVLPNARVEGSIKEGAEIDNTSSTAPKTNIILDSLAVFSGDRLVGHLTEEESIAFNFIRDNITYTIIPFKCDEVNYATLEVVSSKTDFKVEIINDKPFVKINTKVNTFLSEINCRNDITKQGDMKDLSDLAAKHLKKLMSDVIDKVSKQYGADIFGFGQYLYRNNNSYWKEIRNNWPKVFSEIDYEIKVNIGIDKKGSILESAKEG